MTTGAIQLPVLRKCARCGSEHSDIEFEALERETFDRFTHWAPCPNNGQPVLIALCEEPSSDTIDEDSGGAS